MIDRCFLTSQLGDEIVILQMLAVLILDTQKIYKVIIQLINPKEYNKNVIRCHSKSKCTQRSYGTRMMEIWNLADKFNKTS